MADCGTALPNHGIDMKRKETQLGKNVLLQFRGERMWTNILHPSMSLERPSTLPHKEPSITHTNWQGKIGDRADKGLAVCERKLNTVALRVPFHSFFFPSGTLVIIVWAGVNADRQRGGRSLPR